MALTTDQFRDQLIASGLLPPEDIASILSSLPSDRQPQDGEQLARELVRQKKLTKYQAEQIYSGKGKTLVLGNYVILDKLGQGGMGVVLKAEHKRLKRLVALKVMSASIVKTPDALKRFHREVEAAAKLRHNNVVATDDADEAKGTHFLVMEYVEGSDLSALVKKKGPLSVSQAVPCILQAARGLEFAHSQGVVHRDIKPANLLLDSKGTVKILDMGLARIEGDKGSQAELTSTGAVMGTVDYMAPEQALSTKHADARSDIYSLGISLWYLLTGKCAYDGDTLMSKLLAHRDAPIPSLCRVDPDIPASVDAVFQRMVAKQAKDRYQSMTEVIRDLEGCQNGSSSGISGAAPSSYEDPSLQSFLSNLGAASSSNAPMQLVTAPVPGVKVNSANEATMINGSVGVNTDPGTMTSMRAEERQKRRSRQLEATQAIAPPLHQNLRVLLGGAAAAVVLLIAVILLIQTPHGTLRVEILDPEVEVTVKGTELTLSGTDIEPISLKTGEKKLVITRGDLSFETDSFTLRKGTETRVKVELLADKLVVNGDGKVIAEQPIKRKGITTSTTGNDPAFSQWLKDVQALPAEKQLEAVSKKLVELNPGFDGKFGFDFENNQLRGNPKVESGAVTQLSLMIDRLTDLSPLRAFAQLKSLIGWTTDSKSDLRDLSPLTGLPLTELVLFSPKLTDLTPLKGMRLTKLGVRGCAVTDLAPLKGMPLTTLDCDGMKTTDLSPLQGMPLQRLDINHTLATDFTPLKGMPLDTLYAAFTKMGDLSVLHKMPLTTLEIPGCPNISDLSPLKELPLKYLGVDFKPDRDADIVRSIKTLETINGKSAAEFWKEVEEQQKGKPGITPDGPAPPPAIAPFDAAQAKAHQEAWAKYLGVPVEFTNSLGMKFVLIPPGEFTMGSTPAEIEEALKFTGTNQIEQERHKSEGPKHKVILTQPSYLGVNEVTQAEYEKVMAKNPSHFSAIGAGKHAVAGMETATHPVEKVSWNEAAEFCTRLSEQEKLKPFYARSGETVTMSKAGIGYRLPTEAEWEFACRAGTSTKYWIGDKDEDLPQGCWLGTNSAGRTHKVGELKANPLGLYDIHGNVWEWVQDWWEPKYYGQFQGNAAINPEGPSSGSQRVFRCGSWGDVASYCGASLRHARAPQYGDLGNGFRVSLTVDAVKAATATTSPGTAIDILALVDVPGDCVKGDGLGDFTRDGKTLISPAGGKLGRIIVRYELPAEYQLTAVVERLNGDDGVVFGIAVGGRYAEVGFDVFSPRISGFAYLDGEGANNNETTFKERVLADRKPHTIRITVGERLVRATVDEREIIRWEGDLSRFGNGPKQFWFSAVHQFKFHKLELRPVSPSNNSTKLFMHDPAFPQWVKDVQAMPAEKQLEAVSKKLVELNPGFDGKLGFDTDPVSQTPSGNPKIENGAVTQLSLDSQRLTDLSPLRALTGLKVLVGFASNWNSDLRDLAPLTGLRLTELHLPATKATDLTPLKGMPLTKLGLRGGIMNDLSPLKGMPLIFLDCAGLKTTDLSPLQGMPLQFLTINDCQATDFTPLQGMPLKELDAVGTKISDLSVFRKMPLTRLGIPECPNVSDLSPLKELPLKDLHVDFKPERDTKILQSIKTLETINGKPAAEFWKEVEEQRKKNTSLLDDDRRAAEKLLPHVLYVKLRLKSGREIEVNRQRKETLPTEPFDLIHLNFGGVTPPNDFTSNTLLPAISGLKSLQSIDALWEGSFTAAELARLVESPFAANLKVFLVGGCDLNQENLDHLKKCPRLQKIGLRATRPTVESVTRLNREHPDLKILGLSRFGIEQLPDDATLKEFAALPINELQLLHEVTLDLRLFRSIARLPNLNSITIAINTVKDEQIIELTQCPKLETLSIPYTVVTDQILPALDKITSLRRLDIFETRITDAAVKEFAAKHPNCGILSPKSGPLNGW